MAAARLGMRCWNRQSSMTASSSSLSMICSRVSRDNPLIKHSLVSNGDNDATYSFPAETRLGIKGALTIAALPVFEGFPTGGKRRTLPFWILWTVQAVAIAYNVFEPEDLEFAQAVLDEVWVSLPSGVRSGPRAPECRDWLAKQILSLINNETGGRDHLKTKLLGSDMTAWA